MSQLIIGLALVAMAIAIENIYSLAAVGYILAAALAILLAAGLVSWLRFRLRLG